MNKQMLTRVKKIIIGADRLSDNREQYPIEWLLKKTGGSGYDTRLDKIKDAILCMDINHPNYCHLSDSDKLKVEKLLSRPDIVDIVVLSVFQWFGTNVGKSEVGALLDEIRKLKYERRDVVI